MEDELHGRPWLFDLATPQRGGEATADGTYYSDEHQMILQEPGTPAIEAGSAPKTKKADRESGEDEK